MRNIRLTLAYDGTAYVGWQVQPNGLSIQQVLEEAIQKLTGESVRVLSAGRTDSGVHALGQVASFQTASGIPPANLGRALSNLLPPDIVICGIREVPPEFHATHSAVSKRYRYLIYNAEPRNPFLRNYAWHLRGKLDANAMHAAAQELLGTHDFRSFESNYPNKATSVRTILEATVNRCAGWPAWSPSPGAAPPTVAELAGAEPEQRTADSPNHRESPHPLDAPFVCFDVVADGFLYNMVRAIVGTLVRVGRGRWSSGDVTRIINSLDRGSAGDTAPPHGLYLVEVNYGDQ